MFILLENYLHCHLCGRRQNTENECKNDLVKITSLTWYNAFELIVIWADTDMRLIVKTTAQSVIWADTDIRFTAKAKAKSVIWAVTDIRIIVKATAQSVIWADNDIRLIEKTTAQSVMKWFIASPYGVNVMAKISDIDSWVIYSYDRQCKWYLLLSVFVRESHMCFFISHGGSIVVSSVLNNTLLMSVRHYCNVSQGHVLIHSILVWGITVMSHKGMC